MATQFGGIAISSLYFIELEELQSGTSVILCQSINRLAAHVAAIPEKGYPFNAGQLEDDYCNLRGRF